MRNLEYLSPTSLSLFYKNADDFYMQYLVDTKMPREPQTLAMSAGSAFDAFVKSHLYKELIGRQNPQFELDALFTSQVEEHNRDEAFRVGKELFEQYKASGALADLMLDLAGSVIEPRFEINIKGAIGGYREGAERIYDEVVLLGKPDVFYINKTGARVILDWKVNGRYSKWPTNPMKCYVKLYDQEDSFSGIGVGKWINQGQHKDVFINHLNGVRICSNFYFETLNPDWAQQLTIYSWLCGEDVGSECIHAIDQLCCKPRLRIAIHRLRCSKTFQRHVFDKAVKAWEIIKSDHYYRNLTKEESQARCALLEERAKGNYVVEEKNAWLQRISK